MEPANWNIVILARWNRAILTPKWIAEKVLGLPSGSAVDVAVPVDDPLAPFQVRNRAVAVIPASGQLVLQLEDPTEPTLERALSWAANAVTELPQTPYQACGVNLRYAASEPPLPLLDRMRCPTEGIFAAEGYTVNGRRRGEMLAFHDGALNIIADIPTSGSFLLTCNFERQSNNRDDLLGWLRRAARDYVAASMRVVELLTREG